MKKYRDIKRIYLNPSNINLVMEKKAPDWYSPTMKEGYIKAQKKHAQKKRLRNIFKPLKRLVTRRR